MKKEKPDLREQAKSRPAVTPTNTDVKFAGARNPSVMPGSGRLVTPDPDNVVPGQDAKSS